MSSDDEFECFGQSESLVDRIKDLTEGYGDGLDYVKEIIQNGDDAGATDVKICLDLRSNKEWNATLFDPTLAELQGHAFWFYNNVCFKKEDFDNIIRLGGRHKTKKTGVIGKFGLGFNAVYNITDLPSIVSGESLAMFDPNLKYLAKKITNASKPGIRISLNDTKKLSKYEHQLKPYEGIFGCEIKPNGENSFNGTLFRLPFRVSPSGITNTLYTVERAQLIMKILFEHAETLLLFSQNICNFELYTLSDDDNQSMQLLFRVNKTGVSFIKKFQMPPFSITSLASTEQRDLIEQSNILTLAGHLIDTKATDVEKTTTFIQKIQVSLYKSALFVDIEPSETESYWFQTSKCFPRPAELENEVQCSTSLPCTSVSFRIMKNFDLDKEFSKGHVFCFLPLPKRTSLRFHLNGNFYLTSTREDIVFSSSDRIDAFKSTWNNHLQKCLSNTLTTCCQDMISVLQYDMFDLMSLWPLSTAFEILEIEYFKQVFDYTRRISIFKRGPKAYSIDKCKILTLSFNNEMKNDSQRLLQDIIGDEYFIIQLPESVSKYLSSNGIILKNTIDDYEFARLFITNMKKASSDDAIKIVNYLLSEHAFDHGKSCFTKIGLLLKDNESIPSNVTKKPMKPCDLVNTESNLSELYDQEKDDVFPNEKIFEINKSLLIQMGMLTEFLPSNMILERCKNFINNKNMKYDCWTVLNHYLKTLKTEKVTVKSTSQRIVYRLEPSDQVSIYRNEINGLKFVQAKLKSGELEALIWHSDDKIDQQWSLNELYDESCEIFIHRVKPIFDSCKIAEQSRLWINLLTLKHNDKAETIEQFIEIQKDWNLMSADRKLIDGPVIYKYFLSFMEWLNKRYGTLNTKAADLGLPTNMLFLKATCSESCYEYFNMENVAFTVKHPYSPHFIQLPSELMKFRTLLNRFGVSSRISSTLLLNLLQQIHDKNQAVAIDEATVELCLNIIQELDSIVDIKTYREKIYLPDTNLILRASKELCLNDDSGSWLKVSNTNVVHDCIPIGIAKKLEIIKLQTHFIKRFMKGFAFGQQEPLNARIRKLLDSYPNFFDIFKEFIQNADDAAATEIVFILDNRSHGTKKVFTNEFSTLQGPALCCYNNKTFSENDFDALKTLGVGNKGEEKFKIGKYGVGFNVCYHLTDAPQILSNLDNWVIFDPLCKHFPDLVDNNPGHRIRFDINDPDDAFDQYEDVLNSFLGEFKDKKGLENGTMFRFALRKSKSVLSDSLFTIDQIKENILKNANELKNTMVFLKNIRRMRFVEINEDGTYDPLLIFETKFEAKTDENEYSKFIECFKESTSKSHNEIVKQKFEYNLTIADCLSKDEIKFKIISQIGFDQQVVFNVPLKKYLPHGAIAIPLDNNNKEESFKGDLYCFLPLPIKCEMPYHINGYFALANESRQGLFKMTDINNHNYQWNKFVFNNIIANLMLEAVKYMKTQVEILDIMKYFNFFPKLNEKLVYIDSIVYFKDMIESFYLKIFQSDEALVPIFTSKSPESITWVSLKNKSLYSSLALKDWCYQLLRSKSKFYRALCDILINYGVILCTYTDFVHLLNSAHKQYKKVNEDLIKSINVDYILSFFRNFNLILGLDISCTAFESVNNLHALLEFCFDSNPKAKETLEDVSLCLNAANKIVKFSSRSKLFNERSYQIFKGCEEKFLHSQFLSFLPLDGFTKSISIQDLNLLLPHALDETQHRLRNNEQLFNFDLYPKIDEMGIFKVIFEIIDRDIDKIRTDEKDRFDNREYRDCVIEILSPLSKWAIIPVRFPNDNYDDDNCDVNNINEIQIQNTYAAPVDSVALILRDTSNLFNKSNLLNFRQTFNQLKLPRLYSSNYNIRSIVCNTQEVMSLVELLSLVCKTKSEVITSMTSTSRKELVNHITYSGNQTFGKKQSNNKQKLLSLKLFDNSFGEILTLNNRNMMIISEDISLDGLASLFPSNTYFCAHYDQLMSNLYSIIGCETTSFEKFYAENLPKMNNLTYEEKMTHVQAIKDKFDRSYNINADVQKQLSHFAFIKTASNQTCATASSFYDPRNELFKILLCDELHSFPSEPYNTELWIPFLRKCGLKGEEIFKDAEQINRFLNTAMSLFNTERIKLNDFRYAIDKLCSFIVSVEKKEQILGSFRRLVEIITSSTHKELFETMYKTLKVLFKDYQSSAEIGIFFESIKGLNLIIHEFERGDVKASKVSSIEKFVERDLKKFEQIENHLYLYPDYLHEYKQMFLALGLNTEISYELCMKILWKLGQQKDSFDSFDAVRAMNLLFKCRMPETIVDETLELYLLNGRMELKKSSELYYIDQGEFLHLYNTDFAKQSCLLPLDTLAKDFDRYRAYKNMWNTVVDERLKPKHQPKAFSKHTKKEIIYEKCEVDTDMELKIHNSIFIDKVKELLNNNIDSNDIESLFMNMRFYKSDTFKTIQTLSSTQIGGSELPVRFETRFDNDNRSVLFYQNTTTLLYPQCNLFHHGINKALKLFYPKIVLNEVDIEIIIELMISKQSQFEHIINEYKKFVAK